MVSATNPCGFCMIAWESKQLGGLDAPGGIPEEESVVNAKCDRCKILFHVALQNLQC